MKNRIVEIEWVDACASSGWGTRNSHIGEHATSRCRTIGYLLEKNRKSISVIQSISEDTRNISEVMSIPMGCVTKIRNIR